MRRLLFILCVLLPCYLGACATIAEETIEKKIPKHASTADDTFDLELEGGEIISCTVNELHVQWLDGTRSDWIWTVEPSDPRCEAELERLARE